MPHANAALTARHRLKVSRLIIQDGLPISEVAARFQVSWPTVKRWVDRPGSLVHVDVKKLGNIRDDGGWRYVGHHQDDKNRSATPDKPKNKRHNPKLGYAFVHTVLDDHSRVAYTEVHDDETALTAAAVPHRSVDWFAVRGVIIERVLSDNGGAYRSHPWRDTCKGRSPRSGPARTSRRRTARSSASIAPWPTVGPAPAAIPQRPIVVPHSTDGYTGTTNTGPIPPATISRRSHV